MINPFLVGEGIYLRPLEQADAASVAGWLNDPEVNRTILRAHPLSVKAEQLYIDRLAESEEDVNLGIVLVEGDRLIGVVGLHQFDWRSRHAAFGIVVGAKDVWGMGHGTEATRLMVQHAFKSLNLNRILREAIGMNDPAIKYSGKPRSLSTEERARLRR